MLKRFPSAPAVLFTLRYLYTIHARLVSSDRYKSGSSFLKENIITKLENVASLTPIKVL